jgi:hypothetical protein
VRCFFNIIFDLAPSFRPAFSPSSSSSAYLSLTHTRLRPHHPERKDALHRLDAAHPEAARDERHAHDGRGGGRAGIHRGAGADYAGVGEYWIFLGLSFFLSLFFFSLSGGVERRMGVGRVGGMYLSGVGARWECTGRRRHRVPVYETRCLTSVLLLVGSLIFAPACRRGRVGTGGLGVFHQKSQLGELTARRESRKVSLRIDARVSAH